MYDILVKLLNMSISASVIVAVVLLLRVLLKKAPRKIICILWALVAMRLVFPFNFQSNLSAFNLMHAAVGESGQVEYFQYNDHTEKPKVEFAYQAAVIDAAADYITPEHTTNLYLPILATIWLLGVFAMIVYAGVSVFSVRKEVETSIPLRGRIRVSDEIPSPFILGIVNPIIFVPAGLDEETLANVIAHEEAHIKRKDHWWKPFGYFLLAIYWFNPVLWLAYVLLCKDIEIACDEKVVADMDRAGKAAYSQALLNCSFSRKRIAVCPLAFGENSVKERVKSVLHYKKPTFWMMCAAVAACAAVAVCFLTNPKSAQNAVPEESTGILPVVESNKEETTTETMESTEPVSEEEVGKSEPEVEAITQEISGQETVAEVPMKWEQLGFDCWPVANLDTWYEWSERTPFWQFPAPKGTPVYAVIDGTAVGGFNYDDGNYIEIRITDESDTVIKYSHLEENYVSEAQSVSKGTEIGTVGATGRATGPFLKVEILAGDTVVRTHPITGEVLLNEFAPADMKQAAVTEMDVVLADDSAYQITDAETISKIQDMLSNATEIKEAGCLFHTPMYFHREDGTVGIIYPATDSCDIFYSCGKYYKYGSSDNTEFWNTLGLETDLGIVYRKE